MIIAENDSKYSFEREKEVAVEIFREVINTPMVKTIDIHFHAGVDEVSEFNYSITRFSFPASGTY